MFVLAKNWTEKPWTSLLCLWKVFLKDQLREIELLGFPCTADCSNFPVIFSDASLKYWLSSTPSKFVLKLSYCSMLEDTTALITQNKTGLKIRSHWLFSAWTLPMTIEYRLYLTQYPSNPDRSLSILLWKSFGAFDISKGRIWNMKLPKTVMKIVSLGVSVLRNYVFKPWLRTELGDYPFLCKTS